MNLSKDNNNNIFSEQEKLDIEFLSRSFNLNIKIIEILYNRGLKTQAELNKYFYPNVCNLYNPVLMKNMSRAVKRVKKAIENNEKIVIYGDYDADGVTASAILYKYLKSVGNIAHIHIPSRLDEGYGLNCNSLAKIKETHNPDLIITCDCGISALNEVEYLKSIGVDIIITDHHECSVEVPDCIVVNPKQYDCCYPNKYLSGAAVIFKFVHALSNLETALEYVDLVAVANIADLVPLIDENRLLVQLGLDKINDNPIIGLKLLKQSIGFSNKIVSSDISHKLVPRLNAAGRMGNAYKALEVLIAENEELLKQNIVDLNAENEKRKVLCDELFCYCIEEIKKIDLIKTKVIIITTESWAKGLTGIIASKLCNEFNRPALLLVKAEKRYKGTARSVNGVNIYEVLRGLKELLYDFGGHSQAAGFSILEENVELFKEKIIEYFTNLDDNLFLPNYYYDTTININDITLNFVRELEMLEPTGNANPMPLFLLKARKLNVSTMKNLAHTCLYIKPTFQIMYFNSKNNELFANSNVKNLILELCINHYGKVEVLRGNLKQVYLNEYCLDDNKNRAAFIAFNSFIDDTKPTFFEYENTDINELAGNNKWGTMFIAFDRKSYLKFNAIKPKNIFTTDIFFQSSKNNYSKIFIAPNMSEENFVYYDKIIFLDRPLNDNVISYMNKITKAKIYLPKVKNYSVLKYIDFDREVMLQYYDIIKNQANNQLKKNYFDLFLDLSENNKYLQLEQFTFCIHVFWQIGLINMEYSQNGFLITFNDIKTDLYKSKFYSFFTNLIKQEKYL